MTNPTRIRLARIAVKCALRHVQAAREEARAGSKRWRKLYDIQTSLMCARRNLRAAR